MDPQVPKKSLERARVDAAVDRWRDAKAGPVRLWSELSDGDKERLAMRRLRSVAASLGWDEVLHRIGIRRRVQD
jgi:hypothetical protein